MDGTIRGCRPSRGSAAGATRRKPVRDFCERIGVSKANSTVDVGLLEHCVREDLKQQGRQAATWSKTRSRSVITNYPEEQTEEMELENNREVPEMGNRTVPFSRELYVDGDDFMEVPDQRNISACFPGNEVRFKGSILSSPAMKSVKNEDGIAVKELLCTYDPETRERERLRTAERSRERSTGSMRKQLCKIKIQQLRLSDGRGRRTVKSGAESGFSDRESVAYAEPLGGRSQAG